MTPEQIDQIKEVLQTIMFADDLGDVCDVLDPLCDLAGIPQLEGDHLDGWTDQDMLNTGTPPEELSS